MICFKHWLMAACVACLVSPLIADDAPAKTAPGDPSAAAGDPAPGDPGAEPEKKVVPVGDQSYALGVTICRNIGLTEIEAELDMERLLAGIRDALGDDKKVTLTDEQIQEAMMAFQSADEAARIALAEKQAIENKKAGDAYLAKNKAKEGVKTLENGLQYEVIKSGKGASPKATDTVKVHYHGTLIDGEVFDSSVERGEPIDLPVNGVIQGWSLALQMMKVGDKWRLHLPSDLAYGETGNRRIAPNSVLVFEVELLEIAKPKPPAGGPGGFPQGIPGGPGGR